jgi:hypothetical protein
MNSNFSEIIVLILVYTNKVKKKRKILRLGLEHGWQVMRAGYEGIFVYVYVPEIYFCFPHVLFKHFADWDYTDNCSIPKLLTLRLMFLFPIQSP